MSVLSGGTTKTLKVQGQKIKIKKLSYGEQKEAMSLSKNNEMAMMDNVVARSITEWDIKGEDGNKLLISIESLNLLDAGFINELAQHIMKFNNLGQDEEKNSDEPSKLT